MPGFRIKPGRGLGAALLACLCLLAPAAASADTITVDSAADPGAPATCALRDAITAANTNGAVNGCTAGSGIGVDVVDASGITGQITLTAALPQLTSNMVIQGPGGDQLTISGDDAFRPFSESAGVTAAITNLTISHGFALVGGAITSAGTLTLNGVTVSDNAARVTGGTNTFPEAGAIHNNGGTLILIRSSVTGNTASATGGTSQNAPEGGAIFSNGVLSADRSTISNNTAFADAQGGGFTNAVGGALDLSGGSATFTRSTISGNTATATGGSTSNGAQGGAIAVANALGVTLSFDRVTVAGNTASASGTSPSASAGGVHASGGAGAAFIAVGSTISGNSAPLYANISFGPPAISIKNTIVANPAGGGANCNTGFSVSAGYNIDSGTSCGFNQTGDQTSTDPLLNPTLADDGGETLTLLPLPDSPAIDTGFSAPGTTSDQRELQRPWLFDVTEPSGGNGTDIGAVEVQGPVPTGTTPASPNTSGTPNVFGTVESGSTVQLFGDGACGTQVTTGPAATFLSPGLVGPVPPASTTTFSVRSQYGSATSICSPTTIDYTNTSQPLPPPTTPPSTTTPIVPKKKCKKKKHRSASAAKKKKCKKKKK